MKIMKKLAYLSVLAGLFLTGCIAGDYGIEPADPQVNEQDEIVNLAGTAAVTEVAAIDLAAVEGETVSVGTLAVSGLDSVKDIKYYVTFDETYEFPTTAGLELAVEDLQAMVEDAYGKRPTARTFEALVKVNAVINGTAMIFESEEFEVVLTSKAPFIDKAYYLVGDMCGWSKEAALKFNHSGNDVYEDPVFTIVVKVPDNDGNGADYWKVIPGGNYDSADGFWAEGTTGVLGVAVDGDDSAEGTLVTTSPQAAKINFNTAEGSMNLYKITLNMMDYTYKVEELNFVEYIYVPGNHQGWSPATAPALWGPNFDGVWTGFSMLDGGFKFTHVRDWNRGEYKGSDFATKSEGLSGDNDIIASKKAFYYIKADVANSKLEVKEITSFGIIGPAQDGGWEADTDMTWDAEKGAWVASNVTLKADELKFRANDGWDVNVGGSLDDLVENGNDIKVEAGTYDI